MCIFIYKLFIMTTKEFILSSINEYDKRIMTKIMTLLEETPALVWPTIQYWSSLINSYIDDKIQKNNEKFELCLSKIATWNEDALIDSDKYIILRSVSNIFCNDWGKTLKKVKAKYKA